MPGTFPLHRLQRKPLLKDHGMHQGTCVTHVPWCMSGSRTRSGRENVPGIPGACTTHNFTYLVRGPWSSNYSPCETMTSTSIGCTGWLPALPLTPIMKVAINLHRYYFTGYVYRNINVDISTETSISDIDYPTPSCNHFPMASFMYVSFHLGRIRRNHPHRPLSCMNFNVLSHNGSQPKWFLKRHVHVRCNHFHILLSDDHC